MTSLLEAMIESARRCGAGFESTAETGSAVDALVDSALLDSGPLPNSYAGGWCYRPNAAAANKLRALPQAGSFNTQVGGLVPIRAWSVAPTAEEPYHLYAALPPRDQPGQTESWARLVNRALQNMWNVDELPVGSGQNGYGTRWFPVLRAEVVMIAAVVVAGGSGAVVTAPSGWTLVSSTDLSTTIKLALYTRRSRLTDPIEWTWSFDQARVATGFIAAYLDPNPTAPIDVSGGTTVSATAAIVAPAVTTAADNEAVMRIVVADVPLTWTPAGQSLQRRIDATLYTGDAGQGMALFDSTQTLASVTDAMTLTGSQAANQIVRTVAWARRDATHRTLFAGSSVASTIADGADSLDLGRPLNLPNDEWLPGIADTRRCFVRRYQSQDGGQFFGQPFDLDMNKGGRWWKLHEDGADRYLELSPWAKIGDTVILEVQRPFMPLVADDDETPCPLEVLALRTRYEFFSYLNSAPATRGNYSVEMTQALSDWMREYKTIAPQQAVVGA